MPYIQLVIELCRSVVGLGARKVFLLNGHGGNDVPVRAALRELKSEFPKERFVFASYWSLAAESIKRVRESGPGGLGHACEMETSIMLHLCPSRVKMSLAKRDGPRHVDPYRKADMQYAPAGVLRERAPRGIQVRHRRPSRAGDGGEGEAVPGGDCEGCDGIRG